MIASQNRVRAPQKHPFPSIVNHLPSSIGTWARRPIPDRLSSSPLLGLALTLTFPSSCIADRYHFRGIPRSDTQLCQTAPVAIGLGVKRRGRSSAISLHACQHSPSGRPLEGCRIPNSPSAPSTDREGGGIYHAGEVSRGFAVGHSTTTPAWA